MIAELGISLNNFMDALSYNRVKALDYNRNLSISDLVSKTQYTTLAEMHGIVNASTNDTSIIKKIWNEEIYNKLCDIKNVDKNESFFPAYRKNN